MFEDLARALGIQHVHVVDPMLNPGGFRSGWSRSAWTRDELSVIIARRTCLLAAGRIKSHTNKCDDQES